MTAPDKCSHCGWNHPTPSELPLRGRLAALIRSIHYHGSPPDVRLQDDVDRDVDDILALSDARVAEAVEQATTFPFTGETKVCPTCHHCPTDAWFDARQRAVAEAVREEREACATIADEQCPSADEVKRYDLVPGTPSSLAYMKPYPDGKWVPYDQHSAESDARVAEAVREERERCAKVAAADDAHFSARRIAAAIRARNSAPSQTQVRRADK